MLATVALGLAGYIAYRLTRPKVVMVTCANCGRLRRPDLERCQHCGRSWEMGDLGAPGWRVRELTIDD